MNKIRVIDLLNKIAKGEEVPKKIKYENDIYEYREDNRQGICYLEEDTYDNYLIYSVEELNDEVEIIEENKRIKMNIIEDIIDKIENDEKPPTLNDIREMCGLPRIEEKKIEKISWSELLDILPKKYTDEQNKAVVYLGKKINEIIDKINNDK